MDSRHDSDSTTTETNKRDRGVEKKEGKEAMIDEMKMDTNNNKDENDNGAKAFNKANQLCEKLKSNQEQSEKKIKKQQWIKAGG